MLNIYYQIWMLKTVLLYNYIFQYFRHYSVHLRKKSKNSKHLLCRLTDFSLFNLLIEYTKTNLMFFSVHIPENHHL